MSDPQAEQELDHAFAVLERQVPPRLAAAIRWVRDPDNRRIRWAIGGLCIVLSFFAWLPVIGIELLPIGLLLIAVDIPVLRRPVAVALLWMIETWAALRMRWLALKRRGASGPS